MNELTGMIESPRYEINNEKISMISNVSNNDISENEVIYVINVDEDIVI